MPSVCYCPEHPTIEMLESRMGNYWFCHQCWKWYPTKAVKLRWLELEVDV